MNKPSKLLWLFVLAQICAVAAAIGWKALQPAPLIAPIKTVRADINGGLKTTLGLFEVDCGRFPTTAEGLSALIKCPPGIPQGRWRGPYLDPLEIPRDPWGHEYGYRYPGVYNTNTFELYSTGPDGISRSGGDDPDDINSWDPGSPHGGNFSRDPHPIVTSTVLLVLLFIPLSFLIYFIVTILSPSGRKFSARNQDPGFVWLVTSLIAFVLFMQYLIPQIVSR